MSVVSSKKPVPPAELNLFELTWPIFVENLLMTLIGTLGLWMAGHASVGAVGQSVTRNF